MRRRWRDALRMRGRTVRRMGHGMIAAGVLLPLWGLTRGPDVPPGALRPEMMRVPAGTFWMGSPEDEEDRDDDETRHQVELTRAFEISRTEVTQGQFLRVMGWNPAESCPSGEFVNLSYPVSCVTWADALEYANRLSSLEGLDACYELGGSEVVWRRGCGGYRLPTEAEWEYAARGGASYVYSGSDELSAVGWYGGNSAGGPHAVGTKSANGWGLYDMSGNVWEWCWDRYQQNYQNDISKDPVGPQTGSSRVYRGGAWGSYALNARVADRRSGAPSNRNAGLGLRLSRSLP